MIFVGDILGMFRDDFKMILGFYGDSNFLVQRYYSSSRPYGMFRLHGLPSFFSCPFELSLPLGDPPLHKVAFRLFSYPTDSRAASQRHTPKP